MLIVIATLLIGAPIAIIIKALWTILLAFLLVVALIRTIRRSTNWLVSSSRSRWPYNRRTTVAIILFFAAPAILTVVLLIDCRYVCHGWQSNGLDAIAAFTAFLMGMILERWIDPKTLSPGDWGKLAVGLIIVLGIAFVLVNFLQPDPAWRKFPILALAFALPIFGIAIRVFCPRLF